MDATILMDSSIQNVVLGVIANGLTGLITYSGYGLKRHITRNKKSLLYVIEKGIQNTSENLTIDDNITKKDIKQFISSPEVESIVRQIYSTNLSINNETEIQELLVQIKKEFLISFSLFIGSNEPEISSLGEYLLKILVDGCEEVLNIAIGEDILSAHEAKSSFRHQIMINEIKNIHKNIEYLTKPQKPDLNAIIEFEEKYRQQVAKRHGYILPPHFDAVKKLKIENLYVNPKFKTNPIKKDELPALLDTEEFLSQIHRAVILGNPGGGKSTFADKMCHDLASKYNERLFNNRLLTPIHVVLRDYGTEKKNHHCSLLEFIESTAKSTYQLKNVPNGAFEYMLLNGRAIIIFDGLDELLETRHRQEITANVESFCNLYPSVPVLITSRTVGYEQAPLDEEEFKVFNLTSFDKHQVEEYVKKWFAADPDLTRKEKKQKINSFLQESEIVPDLRSNPLMLALMCNIYKGENYIPENRPDVYEKCAKMLFEQWDQRRDIKVSLPFINHISPAMKHLAYWIYTNEKIQGGVNERSLINETTNYLHKIRFENRDDAEKAASDFIDFCKGRAWVFTDTGTTKEGERLYQFTHQTFLEYFAASQLVRLNETSEELMKILYPRIAKREWDVVAQLAFQIKNRNSEGAGDKLITYLLSDIESKDFQTAWNLLSFSIRSLEFMVPSPKITRNIANVCIERFLVWGIDKKRFVSNYRKSKENPNEIVNNIRNIAGENHQYFDDEFQRKLIEIINNSKENEAILALEIGLKPLGIKSITENILESCWDRINELYPDNFELCYDLHRSKKITIQEFVNCHGLDAIFKIRSYKIFQSKSPSFSNLFMWRLEYPETNKTKSMIKNYEDDLEYIGKLLLSKSTPWTNRCGNLRLPINSIRKNNNYEELEIFKLNPDALFGALLLIGSEIETDERFLKRFHHRIKMLDSFNVILIARFEDKLEKDKITEELDKCKFTSDQQNFIWKWIKKEINFCFNPK